ncbi:MAG: gamma-glutamyltransferase family protein [Tatlockia sp.]|jgi:gamma-glutamyltranspeptidase/glutathione hydrolase|nr:gamma-glutamyltransferase family protein [Tatlockia sp.]
MIFYDELSNKDSRSQTRSQIISKNGVAATSQIGATQTAINILDSGGSAVDAAIAANAVLCVTEPMMCGIGGDLSAIIWDEKRRQYIGLNGTGWSPEHLTFELFQKLGFRNMPDFGVHSVTVPGCVKSWEFLHDRFGVLDWSSLFADAVEYAESGFFIPEVVSALWTREGMRKSMKAKSSSSNGFLKPKNKPYHFGDFYQNKNLAEAFRLISQYGAKAFYRGSIGKAVLDTCRSLGGVINEDDLAEYEAEWVTPLSQNYRDAVIYELPPNTQGVVALVNIGLLNLFPPFSTNFDDSQELHRMIEAMKIAYNNSIDKVADPRFSTDESSSILAETNLVALAQKYNPNFALKIKENRLEAGGDTVYLTTSDKDGNMVSLTQSIFWSWGAGIVVEKYGFALQNRANSFSLDPKSPNFLLPRKRPYHTIIPGFLETKDIRAAFGIMGGLNQPLAHAQFVVNLVDRKINPQLALDYPRFTSLEAPFDKIYIESAISEKTYAELCEKGHEITRLDFRSLEVGRGQAILKEKKRGVYYGASDSRGDGCALAQPF